MTTKLLDDYLSFVIFHLFAYLSFQCFLLRLYNYYFPPLSELYHQLGLFDPLLKFEKFIDY
jgi:hypothetical protein